MLHLLSMSPLLIFPEECIGRGAQVPCCLVLHPLFPSAVKKGDCIRPRPAAADNLDTPRRVPGEWNGR